MLGASNDEAKVQTVARPETSLPTLIGDLMTERTGLAKHHMDRNAVPDVVQILVGLISTLFAFGLRKEGKISPKVEDEASQLAVTYLESKIAERREPDDSDS